MSNPMFSSVVAPPLHPLKEEPASFEQLDQTQDASKKRISLLPNRLMMLIIQRERLTHLPGALYCALLLREPPRSCGHPIGSWGCLKSIDALQVRRAWKVK